MPMERKSVCLGMQGTINKYQSCFSEFNHIDIECEIMNTMRSSIFPVIHLLSEFWFVLRQCSKHFPGLISHFSNTVYNQLINYLFIHHYINQSKTSLSISMYLHIVMFLASIIIHMCVRFHGHYMYDVLFTSQLTSKEKHCVNHSNFVAPNSLNLLSLTFAFNIDK